MRRFGRACRRRASALVAIWLAAVLPGARPAGAAATVTFGGQGDCTCPAALKVKAKTITVDLSAVASATVRRAVLAPKRGVFNGHDTKALAPVRVRSGERDVPLLAPRYRSFDATEAVRAALKGGKEVRFQVDSLPGWDGRTARLEVTVAGKWTGKPLGELPAVSNLTARHRGGQTILTFREAEPPVTDAAATVGDLRAARKKLTDAARKITYRIYRSATGKGDWRLIDEIGPLTCWNTEYYGVYPKADKPALRYVVDEGRPPVAPGTGIYAHNPAKAGKAWYAVSAAVNGVEDLGRLGEGSTVGPVDETHGPGEFILQRVEKPERFMYRAKPTLRYYVRWEAPPRCNVPSRPLDYLLAVPGKVTWPAGVNIAFHCWGGSLNGGYGWWYRQPPRAPLMISTNQIPYDWWTGYHEARGTWRPWSAGVVRSYTFRRVNGFFEWVCKNFQVDRSRVHNGGNSMGGAGSLVHASHHPEMVGWVSSWVGVHIPARTPHFRGSYELCYGRLDWKLKHETGQTAFDYFDDAAWIRSHPDRSMPFMAFGNGKNDGGIGWPQAVEYLRALQEARQPHLFHWALGGHGVRATLPGPASTGSSLGIDIRTDQSLPAFTRCSLDDDPGSAKLLAKPAEHRKTEGGGKVRVLKDRYDGDPQGYVNRWLYWHTKTIVDEPGRWEMTVALMDKAPREECTVDVTPRRLQKLKADPGNAFTWTVASAADGKVGQRGEVSADKHGRITLEKVKVLRQGSRLVLRAK